MAINFNFATQVEYQSNKLDKTKYGNNESFQEACQLINSLVLENLLSNYTSDIVNMLNFDIIGSSLPIE